MKHIFLNLKRFDVPGALNGVNTLSPIAKWGSAIVSGIQDGISPYCDRCEFSAYFPEAHLLTAVQAKKPEIPLHIGCQGVYEGDLSKGGNFGAFTTLRPAAAAKALGCDAVIIGHCEERNEKAGILAEGGVTDPEAVNRILNREIKAAQNRGLKILYCIGEKEEERENWKDVLRLQLKTGLQGTDLGGVVIAYEPVWAIGPGKTPPDRETIKETAAFIKEIMPGMDVVYGGGLKGDNAKMLASIPEIDGGLIALTRFSGEIGFYPEEYLEIVSLYLGQ